MGESFSYEKFFNESPGKPAPKRMKSTISLLGEAWQVYRKKFRSSLGIMAVPIGFYIFYLFLFYFLQFSSFRYSFFYSLLLFLLGAGYLVLSLCSIPALLYSFKEDIGVKNAYRRGWQILPSYIWVTFIYLAIVIGGLILLIVPGFLFSIWFCLYIFVLIYEGRKGFSALERSRRLVKGHFWSTFWKLFLINIIISLISFPFILVIPDKIDDVLLANLVRNAMGSLLQLFLLPFFFAFLLSIYENLKEIKQEEPDIAFAKRVIYLIPAIPGTLALCFGLAIVLFAIFWGRDIPPIDDSDLRLTKVDIPREENAHYDLMKASEKQFLPKNQGPAIHSMVMPELTGWEGLFYDMITGKRLGTKEADELIAKNEELFKYFEMALQRPYLQLPQIADPEKINSSVLFPELSKYRELARWGVVRARYLIAKGKEEDGFEWFFKVLKFGDMIKRSPRPVLIQYLVAEAVQTIALKPMREELEKTNLPSFVLSEYARRLLLLVEDYDALKNTYRMEYMFVLNAFKDIEKSLLRKSSFEKLQEELEGEAKFIQFSFFP
ncbi:hypothetical protein H5T87_11410 [bacterium]|nr:hypothetical protein [bacterium]